MHSRAVEPRPPDAGPCASPLVLVVDEEVQEQNALRALLRSHGYRTVEADSGAKALACAATYNPELVLLDSELPGSDGVVVTRELRQWMAAPIVVISARGDERDKVSVLDAGANDYVTKPFRAGELMARVRVWLRQMARISGTGKNPVIEAGGLRLDLARRLVSVGERSVHLTPLEYKLFAILMRNKNRPMRHRELLDEIRGARYRGVSSAHLRIYMQRLRQKLEQDVARPRYLLTEHGFGYRLRAG